MLNNPCICSQEERNRIRELYGVNACQTYCEKHNEEYIAYRKEKEERDAMIRHNRDIANQNSHYIRVMSDKIRRHHSLGKRTKDRK